MRIPIIKDLASLAYHDILKRRKATPFLVFISFLASFGVARLTVNLFPGLGLQVKQYNIHHFYYGIALLSVAGWVALVSNRPRLLRLASILFGAGLGMITDEIGLLLTCTSEALNCNYYARASYDFAVIIALLFFSAIYFVPFWLRVKSNTAKAVKATRIARELINTKLKPKS